MVGRVGEGFLRDLRIRVFDHLQRLSMPYYDREKAGVIVSRMTSDIDSLQELVQMGLLQFLSSALLIVLSVVVLAARVAGSCCSICLIPLPFVVLASIKFQRDSNRAYLSVRDRIGMMLSSLQEGIAGVRVIQAFGREDVETDRFGARNRTLYDAHMRSVQHPGLVPAGDRVRRPRHHRPRDRPRRLDGHRGHRHGRHHRLLRAVALEPVRAGAAAVASCSTRCSRPAPGSNKLFELLDTPVDVAERADGGEDLPGHGRHRGRGRHLRLRRRRARCCATSTS